MSSNDSMYTTLMVCGWCCVETVCLFCATPNTFLSTIYTYSNTYCAFLLQQEILLY